MKPSKDEKPLILYLDLEEEAIWAMVAQCEPNEVEQAIYNLSKKLLPYESKYNLIKKMCLVMIWATRKLRHYFQSYRVVKGKAVVELLTQNAIKGDDPWDLEFFDENLVAIEIQEWKIYFNRAVNARSTGLEVALIIPKGEMLPMAKILDFRVTNNMAEYKACLFRLEVTIVAEARQLMVYKVSMLVVQQAI
eukprot:XP_015572993.1 uncharacterized protein LOC107261022 [Ricinus communis]